MIEELIELAGSRGVVISKSVFGAKEPDRKFVVTIYRPNAPTIAGFGPTVDAALAAARAKLAPPAMPTLTVQMPTVSMPMMPRITTR